MFLFLKHQSIVVFTLALSLLFSARLWKNISSSASGRWKSSSPQHSSVVRDSSKTPASIARDTSSWSWSWLWFVNTKAVIVLFLPPADSICPPAEMFSVFITTVTPTLYLPTSSLSEFCYPGVHSLHIKYHTRPQLHPLHSVPHTGHQICCLTG